METSALNTEQSAPKKRPTFLTVLCVLTFIASALSLVFGILAILNMEANLRAYYEQAAQMPTPEYQDMMLGLAHLMEEYGMLLQIMGLIGSLGCIYGAWAMWRLQRMGFYVYALCEITPALFSLYVMGFGSGMFVVMSLFTIGIPALFVFLYALNWKHLD